MPFRIDSSAVEATPKRKTAGLDDDLLAKLVAA
jgi:hypothetical protein